jgi:peptide/nickel transport system substrate-binding protein
LYREPDSLNPIYLDGTMDDLVSALGYSSLTTYDAHDRIVTDVATVVPTLANGGISRDGKRITFHLRRDVKWQDGAPLTSRDVIFTYRAITNPSNINPTDEPYDRITRVQAPDPYTVIVELKRPYAPIVSSFFGGDGQSSILPAHLLAKYRDLNRVAYNSAPVGSGPYRFTKWARGDRIDFTANDRYYAGKPAIRHISLHIIENSATIANELLTGELDVRLDADISTIAALRAIPEHRVIVTPTFFCAVVFNVTDPVLRDVRLRRAFAMAIDRRLIVNKVAHGLDDPDTGMRGLFRWAFDPAAGTLPYDPRRARTLLAQDGWIAGSDGIRVKRGRRLEIQLDFYNSLRGAELIPLIADEERAIGIDVTTRRYGSALFELNGPLYQGRFQAAVLNLEAGTDPDPAGFFACGRRAPHGVNWSRYCNPAVDRAIDRGVSVFDRAARRHAYAFIQRQLIADVPMDFLWQIGQIDVIPSRLQGFDPVLGYASVARWRWQSDKPQQP